MAFGDIYEAYFNYIEGLTGYNENDVLLNESYMPKSTANQSFIFLIDENKQGDEDPVTSGNIELTIFDLIVKVLYKKKITEKYSSFQKRIWNLFDTLERGILNFGNSRGDVILKDSIKQSILNQEFTTMTFKGNLIYTRELSV